MRTPLLVYSLILALVVSAFSISLAEAKPGQGGGGGNKEQTGIQPGFKTAQNGQWIWIELVYKNHTGPDAIEGLIVDPSTGKTDDWCPDDYDIYGIVYGGEPPCNYGVSQWGYMKYVVSSKRFNGQVKATGLKPDALYQVTLNGQSIQGAIDTPGETTSKLLSDFVQSQPGWNVSYGGWWHSGSPGGRLEDGTECIGAGAGGCVHWGAPHEGDEGYFNFAIAILSDSTGAFSHSFDVTLTVGTYSEVKFLMKEVSNGGFGGPFTPVLMEYTQLGFTITTR